MTAALLSLLLALPATPPEVIGELCLFRPDRVLPACRSTTGRRFPVERADAPRAAVWWNRDGTEAAVGTIDADTESIDLQSPAWQPVAIELRGTRDALPPVTMSLRAPGVADAVLTVPAHRVTSLRRLWLPARDAAITFEAEHHDSVVRDRKRGSTSLGVITLKAHPLLTGTIVTTESQEPLPYATIVLPSGVTAGTADATGRFRLWVSGNWPEFLRITSPGRASASVAVPKIIANVDLGQIRLGTGGTLRVHLGERPPLEIRLLRRAGEALHETAIRPEVSGTVDFERLESERYVLVLRGTGPLQQLAMPVDVRDGETTTIEPRIEPAELSIEVRRGNAGTAASIDIRPAAGEWQTAITTGEDGRYEGEIWQRGDFISFVAAGDTTVVRHDRLEGREQIHWPIDLPHLRVSGTVTDAGGKPLVGAEVTLDTVTIDSSTQSAEITDTNGRFTFRGVEEGHQTLTATADGYLSSTLSFPLTQDHATTIRLQRGVRRTLIVTRQGQPIANATVIDENGSAGEQHTDAEGRLELTMAPGERKTVYVLPPDGSFAAVEVEGNPQRVDVPPGAATIRLTALSGDHAPIGRVFFALRYNGRMLSAWVRAILHNRRGIPLETGADGVAMLAAMPPGVYEIWPYFRADELPRIAAGLVPARARIAVQAGLNEVRFTFEEE